MTKNGLIAGAVIFVSLFWVWMWCWTDEYLERLPKRASKEKKNVCFIKRKKEKSSNG